MNVETFWNSSINVSLYTYCELIITARTGIGKTEMSCISHQNRAKLKSLVEKDSPVNDR